MMTWSVVFLIIFKMPQDNFLPQSKYTFNWSLRYNYKILWFWDMKKDTMAKFYKTFFAFIVTFTPHNSNEICNNNVDAYMWTPLNFVGTLSDLIYIFQVRVEGSEHFCSQIIVTFLLFKFSSWFNCEIIMFLYITQKITLFKIWQNPCV